MPRSQTRRITLAALVTRRFPGWDDHRRAAAIGAAEFVVEGRVVTNPRALVAADAALRHVPPTDLAGRRKLAWAIERFGVAASGATALDVGSCTGGFTTAWLEAGAARVYAVDVGHGQLLGSLRADPRVVNLEHHNVADLTTTIIPQSLNVVSVDVSYLSLSAAVAALRAVTVEPGAELLGLVKPMFELRLATIPADPATLERACEAARAGVAAAGWDVLGTEESPVRGGRGAVEFFLHARLR